ncbi:TPA: hypothetical protein RQN74_003204 [Klebsiella oxytoca]|nr:hypothetical protein [Klebsiella oxytoca]
MSDWFMSYKIYFDNGGVFENFEFYGAASNKSGVEVAKECAAKIAQQHHVKPEQIMFISFNRV